MQAKPMNTKKIIREIKYWSQLFLLPICGLAYLLPRSRKIWVLGSSFGRRFADNPKYFYLYLTQYRKEQVRAIWITKNKDVVNLLRSFHLESYYLYSLKGVLYSLRAKVYLYDNYTKDISYPLSSGAIKINLWHGIPLKKIQKDNHFDYVRNPRSRRESSYFWLRRLSDEKPSHYILASSKNLEPMYSSAFQTKKVIVGGYPRNDSLYPGRLRNLLREDEQQVADDLARRKGNARIVLYMPTFRESEAGFFDLLDADRFQLFLKENQILFVIKPHPKSKQYEKYVNLSKAQIMVIDPVADPYPILSLSDLLVTDYSSIYFDYLHIRKPILFFPYDLEEYLKSSREMYFDYEEFTPGPKVYDQTMLEEALLKAELDEGLQAKVRDYVFDKPGAFASQQLYENITRLLDKHTY